MHIRLLYEIKKIGIEIFSHEKYLILSIQCQNNSVCKACAAINLEKKYVVNIYLLGGYDGGRSLYVFELGFYMH